MTLRLDHVVWMTRDLDGTAGRLLAEHDLGSLAGGEHPAWGTANRIVPAGPSYVELMGIADHDRAGTNPLGRTVIGRTTDGDCLAAVCLATDDLDAVCARLGIAKVEGSRVRPDGSTLVWHLAGMEEAMVRGVPFFIQWDRLTGADVPDPDVGQRATAIRRVALGGDADAARAWTGEAVPGLDLVGGETGIHELVLATDGDDVVLSGPLLAQDQ